MVRESKCSLKFTNKSKKDKLDKLFSDYTVDLKHYINLIINKELPLKVNLSSKLLPNNTIHHSEWKQIIYKQASEIIRSNLKYTSKKVFNQYKKTYAKAMNSGKFKWFTNKKYSELKINLLKRVKINIKNENITISIDSRRLNYTNNSNFFNEFVNLKLHTFKTDSNGNKIKRAEQINLPVKYHKHYNQYINNKWKRLNTVKLKKINNNYYIYYGFEKQTIKKDDCDTIGVDIGYKKLITSSNEKYYGKDIERLCNKISRKQRGSKKYNKTLTERTNYINEQCNRFIKENRFSTLIVEDLKNVKLKSKLSRKFNNKIQYWSYKQVLTKLGYLSEKEGFFIIKVSPAYTSQRCSKCGTILKSNRKGEVYKCSCGLEIDADYNASINILQRGVYNPSYQENEKCNIC